MCGSRFSQSPRCYFGLRSPSNQIRRDGCSMSVDQKHLERKLLIYIWHLTTVSRVWHAFLSEQQISTIYTWIALCILKQAFDQVNTPMLVNFITDGSRPRSYRKDIHQSYIQTFSCMPLVTERSSPPLSYYTFYLIIYRRKIDAQNVAFLILKSVLYI